METYEAIVVGGGTQLLPAARSLAGRPVRDGRQVGVVARRAPVEHATLRAVLAPPGSSVSLPGEAYTSAGVFAWELDHLWDGSWVCLGRSTDLGTPGDQRGVRVGAETVLMTRDEAGALHGFFNVCRHRGHELLAAGSTERHRVVKCPYHGWVYGLDGRLRGAPGFRGLDRPSHGLAEVRVAEWRGWVFANLSGDAPELSEHLGNLEATVRDHQPERLVVGARMDYEVEANWKLVHENYQECYHCSSIHPELCAVTPPDSGMPIEPTGVWVGGTMDLRPEAVTMSLAGDSGARPFPGLDDRRRREVLYLGLLPNLLISLHPDYVRTPAGRTSTPRSRSSSGTSPTGRTGAPSNPYSGEWLRGDTGRVRSPRARRPCGNSKPSWRRPT